MQEDYTNDYKERNDQTGTPVKMIKYGNEKLMGTQSWKISKNVQIKILWDLWVQSDENLALNISDITVVGKKKMWVIVVAMLQRQRIEDKELENITKYQGLKIEMEQLWHKSVMVAPSGYFHAKYHNKKSRVALRKLVYW